MRDRCHTIHVQYKYKTAADKQEKEKEGGGKESAEFVTTVQMPILRKLIQPATCSEKKSQSCNSTRLLDKGARKAPKRKPSSK